MRFSVHIPGRYTRRVALRRAALSLLLTASAAAADSTVDRVWIQDPWTGDSVLTTIREPDQSLWDETQASDYEAALQAEYPPPLAVLTIEELGLQVPVYNGTEEHVLDRGAGRIKGMAKPGEGGKLGISAHRDSFFRTLENIETGDEIAVQNVRGVDTYAVTNIEVVAESEVSVLEQTTRKTLVLVTCYPFYYEGHAPQRYIVTAELASETYP